MKFAYVHDGALKPVATLEEREYPDHYHQRVAEGNDEIDLPASPSVPPVVSTSSEKQEPTLEEKHLTFEENQKGVSYRSVFGDYLKGATQLTVTDPYIRLFYQQRNLMELLELVARLKEPDAEVVVHLITVRDEFKDEQQIENFEKMQASAQTVGINFTWEFDDSGSMHARHIITDHGWKISLDRGLDIFQQYEMNDAFTFANRMQQYRSCKAFEVTFIKV